MDAKKVAQLTKPIYLKETKAFKYANWITAGVVVFSFALGSLYIQYLKSESYRKPTLTRFFESYSESEAFKYKIGRLLGLFPPHKHILEKYGGEERIQPISSGV